MYYTQQDIANYNINTNAPLSSGEILLDLINEDMTSNYKIRMTEGRRYYEFNHDILKEDFRKYYDQYNNEQTDLNKANNKLVHAYFNLLVRQKIYYLLKQDITITYEIEGKVDKDTAQLVLDLFGKEFHQIMQDWGTAASNKGGEWIHIYLDKEKFDYVIIPAEQIIPVYETTKQKKLKSLIRYYKIKINEAGKEREQIQAEWWYPDKIEYYAEDIEGRMIKGETKKGHFKRIKNTKEQWMTWNDLPWVLLKNNSKQLTDLQGIKALIDSYDSGESKFVNDLEDLQEAIIKASGVNEEPGDLRDKIRKHKVIVAQHPESDIDFMTMTIPYEARDRASKNLEENIFTIGMGINPKTDKFGNDPSGVALKWLYLPLDLKASALEVNFKLALYKLFGFACEYLALTNQQKDIDSDNFKFTFTKSMLANEKETIENCNASKDTVSEDTVLEHHPWVEDVETEKEKLEKEREKYDVSLENIPGEEIEEEDDTKSIK